MKKIFTWEFLFTSFVIIIGFFILHAKIGLTDNAKLDMVDIKNERTLLINTLQSLNNLNTDNILVKNIETKAKFNSFNGHIVTSIIKDNNNHIVGFTITSDNLPYQACLRYGLDGQDFTTVSINDRVLYKKNELTHRDKILHLCLLELTNSKVELTTLFK